MSAGPHTFPETGTGLTPGANGAGEWAISA